MRYCITLRSRPTGGLPVGMTAPTSVGQPIAADSYSSTGNATPNPYAMCFAVSGPVMLRS